MMEHAITKDAKTRAEIYFISGVKFPKYSATVSIATTNCS
jgi:hypothetical protein